MTTNFVLYYIDGKTNKRYAETLFVNQYENLRKSEYLQLFKKADIVTVFATKKEANRTAEAWNEQDRKAGRLMSQLEAWLFTH